MPFLSMYLLIEKKLDTEISSVISFNIAERYMFNSSSNSHDSTAKYRELIETSYGTGLAFILQGEALPSVER